jgi:hypothetical protein
MIARCITALTLVLAVAAGAAAQQKASEQRKPGNTTPSQPSDDSPPPASMTNVQVEITIADSMGGQAPQKKTVSIIVADGQMGRVRSARNAVSPMLNVDTIPRVTSGRITLRLTLEYTPASEKGEERATPINESVTVLLQSGKPMVISQASDPSMDRKVTVEVTATVLK